MAKTDSFILTKKCEHIAFIMDGNGRWAKARGLARTFGHRKGVEIVMNVFEYCREFNIKYMSVYAFSTENWNRPQDEINCIMDLLEEFFKKNFDYLNSLGCRFIVSGDISKLRSSTRQVCEESINRTVNNSNWYLNICLNYGGRDELVRAAKMIATEVQDGKLAPEDITVDTISKHLYTALMPDVDLMIRTSGEQRLSNFLLFQNAYAEFVFTPVSWPDFDHNAFVDCLKEFQERNRRFGGLKNE